MGTFIPPGNAPYTAALLPGDVVYWGGTIDDYHHSAVYAGNGEVWDDFAPGSRVQLHTMAFLEQSYTYDGAYRYWNGGQSVTPPPPPPPVHPHRLRPGRCRRRGVRLRGHFYGSLPGLGVAVDDITGIVSTAADDGYWLVGADGGVFAFNAPFVNSLPGLGVAVDDIVGIVPTRDDQGYFLVGRDGGVFSFDAPLRELPARARGQVDDIVGIAATADDNGYWLVGSDGSVYAFGDATYVGNAPAGAVAITSTPDGGGYWVVGADGRSPPSATPAPSATSPPLGVAVNDIVGIVVSPDGRGYNLIGRRRRRVQLR